MQAVQCRSEPSKVRWPFLKISGRVGGWGGGTVLPPRMIYAGPVLCFDFNKQSVCHDVDGRTPLTCTEGDIAIACEIILLSVAHTMRSY